MTLPTYEDYERDFTTTDLKVILRTDRDVVIPKDANKAAQIALALKWDREHPDEALNEYANAAEKAGAWKLERNLLNRDRYAEKEQGRSKKAAMAKGKRLGKVRDGDGEVEGGESDCVADGDKDDDEGGEKDNKSGGDNDDETSEDDGEKLSEEDGDGPGENDGD
jgi:hypothetical protein